MKSLHNNTKSINHSQIFKHFKGNVSARLEQRGRRAGVRKFSNNNGKKKLWGHGIFASRTGSAVESRGEYEVKGSGTLTSISVQSSSTEAGRKKRKRDLRLNALQEVTSRSYIGTGAFTKINSLYLHQISNLKQRFLNPLAPNVLFTNRSKMLFPPKN